MKRAFAYLAVMLLGFSLIGLFLIVHSIALPSENMKLAAYCGLLGGVGGVTYCLRGIYLNACVHKRWSDDWLPWYFIRPIVSVICGAISFLFLQAGLIVLEARQTESPSNFAFYALAFVAGLNVDKFIEKVEDIAQVTWGIKKSRTGSTSEGDS